MSVAKRGDGRFVVKFKDEEGRWKQRSFRTDEEARQFDADCQYDKVENTRLTLLEAVLVYLKNTEYAEKTIATYEFLVCGHDRQNGYHREGPAEFIADRFVDTLTRRDLENVRERCRNDGLTMTSINSYVSKLKAAINWCVEQDLLHENPWGKYRQLPGAKNKPRTGTLEDFHKLFPVLPPWLQWAAQTAIALCLRPGISELFRLEWSAFDWKARTVCVYMPKVCTTKLVFPPEAYLAEAWLRFKSDMAAGKTLVCRGRKGTAVTSSMYHKSWDRACKKSAYLCLCTRYGILLLPKCWQMGWTSQQWPRNLGTRTSPQQGHSTLMRWHHPNGVQLHASLIAPTWCGMVQKNNYIINKNNVLSIKAIFLR
jgi:integrase